MQKSRDGFNETTPPMRASVEAGGAIQIDQQSDFLFVAPDLGLDEEEFG